VEEIPRAVAVDSTQIRQSGSSMPSRSEAQCGSRPTTRSQNNIKRSKVYTNDTIRYVCLTTSREPESSTEAPAYENWHAAMEEEYKALMRNNTWHLVPSHCASNIVECNGCTR
jgi:hypothetical protein